MVVWWVTVVEVGDVEKRWKVGRRGVDSGYRFS